MTKHYRVDGTDAYTIEYREESNGAYSIWCWDHPHNAYSNAASDCHLFSSGQVCVTSGKEPRSLDRAKAIAHVWMKGFSAYVRSGQFPNRAARVNV
jgi:hypothetical protein